MADEQKDQAQQAGETKTLDDFQSLMAEPAGIEKATDEYEKIGETLSTLASVILRDTKTEPIPTNVIQTIKAYIAGIDQLLTAQINEILHHSDFQELEGAWRGLHHLCKNTESGTDLKIKVMNVSKEELRAELRKYEGASWDQSPIFKKIHDSGYGVYGGHPYGCLVGDYHFDHSPGDVKMLQELGKVAAAAHCPFLSGAAPSLFKMKSFQELSGPRALAPIFELDEYAPWRALRQSEDSRYISLQMPRVLARLPYGPNTEPVEAFAFEEETADGDHSRYTWFNAAYAMAANVNRAFKLYGWCAKIRGEDGGDVEDIPLHVFPTDDGGTDTKCPTEIAITDRREGELSALGLISLCHKQHSNMAAFFGGQTIHHPKKWTDAESTANERISARLPYLFTASRFAHYLKHMMRSFVGSMRTKKDMEDQLHNWIQTYVLEEPDGQPESLKAERPLKAAKVVFTEIEDDPGAYEASFMLQPHFQVEAISAAIKMVAKVPDKE